MWVQIFSKWYSATSQYATPPYISLTVEIFRVGLCFFADLLSLHLVTLFNVFSLVVIYIGLFYSVIYASRVFVSTQNICSTDRFIEAYQICMWPLTSELHGRCTMREQIQQCNMVNELLSQTEEGILWQFGWVQFSSPVQWIETASTCLQHWSSSCQLIK